MKKIFYNSLVFLIKIIAKILAGLISLFVSWFHPFKRVEDKWEYQHNNYSNILNGCLTLFLLGTISSLYLMVYYNRRIYSLFMAISGAIMIISFSLTSIGNLNYYSYKDRLREEERIKKQNEREQEKEEKRKREEEERNKRAEESFKQFKENQQRRYEEEQRRQHTYYSYEQRYRSTPSNSDSRDIASLLSILELPCGITDGVLIKKQYRKLVLKYHTDTKNGDEEKIKQINVAYEKLKPLFHIN